MGRIAIYAQFTLKDKPKDFEGITSESWNFGKEEFVPWHDLIMSLIFQSLEFSMQTGVIGTREEATEELKKVRDDLIKLLEGK
jgi:hypothetical protein